MKKFSRLLLISIVGFFLLSIGMYGVSDVGLAEERVEIEFWYGLGGKLGEVMEDLIARFNASQKEVLVKGIIMPDYISLGEKFLASIAAGNPPACVQISGENVTRFASKNALWPLDEHMEKTRGFNKEDIMPAFLETGVWNGVQYMLPLYGTTQVLYYRKDIFKELGLSSSLLETWEGLASAARKIKVVKDGEITRWGWEPMWGSGNLLDAATSRGLSVLSTDRKKVLFDSPEWVYVWEQFRKWLHEEKIMRIHSGGTGWAYWYATINDVLRGLAGGYTGSSGDQGDLDFTIVDAHIQPGWQGVHRPRPTASALQFAIPLLVPKEKREAAWKWMVWRISSDIAAEWSIRTGYIPVRISAMNSPAFVEYAKEHPQALIPVKQSQIAIAEFRDPTGGKIWDALAWATDRVEIENISAEKALKEAAREAQTALDKIYQR